MQFSSLLLLTGTARLALATYSLSDDYLQNGFFSNWDFFTGSDPTNGYVTYVDQSTAQSNGYINTNSDGSIYMGVDYTNVASGSGRNSVRISSQKAYTHYLAVIDLGHMPGGICGTWPAFWSFGSGGSGWPSEGEIDIIEGVNDQQNNFMTLHAGSTCSISSANSLVQPTSEDCNVYDNGNEGCSFHDSNSNSYGSQFNSQGGGTYATEWTSAGVSIWFWPAGGAPSDALGSNPDPSNWGTPTAIWGGSGCDWDASFMDHNLVFDITFCGDWAGNAFSSCSAANGGQTCQAFVQNNPSAFKDAYWQINALKVYQDNGAAAPPSSSAAPQPSSTPVSSPISTPVAQSTTFATAASSAPVISEGSTGGIFLPNPTPSSELPQPTVSTPATTAPAVTTPAAAPPASTSIQFWGENPTGGVYEPAPTQAPESEGDNGQIYGPGWRKRAIDFPEVDGQAKSDRRRLAHLHRHIGRDGKF